MKASLAMKAAPEGPADLLALGDRVRARWGDPRELSADELAEHAELLERVDPAARASVEALRLLHERMHRWLGRLRDDRPLDADDERERTELVAIAPPSLWPAGAGGAYLSHFHRDRDRVQRAAELAAAQARLDRWANLPMLERVIWLLRERTGDAALRKALRETAELLAEGDEVIQSLSVPEDFGRKRQ